MFEHRLEGCRPEPLGSYLKALGVHRLVARVDADATMRWDGDVPVLGTALDRESLLAYFCDDFTPTPVLTAWNGGGGLYKQARKDPNTGEIVAFDKATSMTRTTDALEEAEAPRLQPLATFITLSRWGLEVLGLENKPSTAEKAKLLEWLRNRCSDDVLPWLDAAFVLQEDNARYPPLLGTGGNDGRLDFGNNYQQHLLALMDPNTGEALAPARPWLVSALFAAPQAGLVKAAPGQFDAGRGGGANSGAGFSGASLVNPWDFVLFLEGAMTLAGAATKRLESTLPGALSYPFTVRVAAAGSAGLAGSDEESGNSRHEIWLPLWTAPAHRSEIAALFGEGRVTIGRRAAKDAVDFARALTTLGVDRGIEQFVRFGFLKRNGLAFIASPLGRWNVTTPEQADLIDGALDIWLQRLQRAARDKGMPASLGSASRNLFDAVMRRSQNSDPADVQQILASMSEVERLISRSRSVREKLARVPMDAPTRHALATRWAAAADDGSPEFRLALVLARNNIRGRMMPDVAARSDDSRRNRLTWTPADIVSNLIAYVSRLEIEGPTTPKSVTWARLADVCAFVNGDVDDHRLRWLTEALAVLRFSRYSPEYDANDVETDPLWAMAALAWDQRTRRDPSDPPARSTPGMVAHGQRGDSMAMSEAALRRLRPRLLRHRTAEETLGELALGPQRAVPRHTRRCIAALAFPLSPSALSHITTLVFRNPLPDGKSSTPSEASP